jgi:hypothetical protein
MIFYSFFIDHFVTHKRFKKTVGNLKKNLINFFIIFFILFKKNHKNHQKLTTSQQKTSIKNRYPHTTPPSPPPNSFIHKLHNPKHTRRRTPASSRSTRKKRLFSILISYPARWHTSNFSSRSLSTIYLLVVSQRQRKREFLYTADERRKKEI